MDKQLRVAYYDYLDALARAGVIDHALNNAILEGKTVEEHIVEVLRAAGKLPEGWGREQDQPGPPQDGIRPPSRKRRSSPSQASPADEIQARPVR